MSDALTTRQECQNNIYIIHDYDTSDYLINWKYLGHNLYVLYAYNAYYVCMYAICNYVMRTIIYYAFHPLYRDISSMCYYMKLIGCFLSN